MEKGATATEVSDRTGSGGRGGARGECKGGGVGGREDDDVQGDQVK
jgi:hypothetical protein